MGNIIGGPGAAIGGTSVPVINTGAAVVGIPRPLSPGLNYGERRSVDAIGLPPIAGRIPLTTPPGVPSPSPPPSVIGAVVQTGILDLLIDKSKKHNIKHWQLYM